MRVVVALTVLLGCATEPYEPLPEWVDELIADIESQPVTDPPLWIARYDFRGQHVYYVPQHCCDFPSVLYDSQGTIICSPDGGISGSGDGRCPDFFAERQNERVLWRDARAPPNTLPGLPLNHPTGRSTPSIARRVTSSSNTAHAISFAGSSAFWNSASSRHWRV